jgi:DNA-binding NarL/FixJ family response regulator
MGEPATSPPRLRVALLEAEPIRVQGFVTLFQDHPRIEFVVFELAQFLADQEFKLALVGLHGDHLPLPLVATIHGMRPDVRLIVMGPDADDEVILQAVTAGAKAYLEASATPQQVEQAIEIVSQGSIWAPRRVLSIFVDRATRSSRVATPAFTQFTARETEVLKLLVNARSNREIARTMGIEERTVKAHVAKLMRKVGVENRIALSIYAVTNAIVTPDPDELT